jgi:hypothetical protein
MSDFQKLFLAGVGAGMTLVAWGWVSTPGVGLISVIGAYAILFLYALLGYWGVPFIERIQPAVAQWVVFLGLLAGLVFAGGTALEYATLPASTTFMQLVEFGLAFFLYFLAGLLAALRTQRWRDALAVATGTSMLGALLWLIATLFTFYLFRGTPPQQQVLFAEGSYDNFVRSGMASFEIFIMEDLFGRTLLYLLFEPLAALGLGLLAGLPGRIRARLAR